VAKARYAADRLGSASGVRLAHPDADVFKEFGLRTDRDARDVQRDLLDRGFLVGPIIGDAEGDVLLASVTERRTREEIDALAKAFEEVAPE